ncbi:MAG: folate family ECF transporter S component [Ruminococcaceae bacterium]|nr:folate family ECF transporter S component [Oscillospiraceae bacterium]
MNLFQKSAKELKNPKCLVTTAMLIAIGVVLSAYATIRFPPDFQVSFGFLASGMIAQLFGPVVNAVAGFITDIVSYLLYTDGPYCFWFALNPIVSGIIFSFFFYGKKVTLPKAIGAKLIDTLVVEIGMTTVWLIVLYGANGWAWFFIRAIGKLVACIIQAPVLYLVMKTVEKVKKEI